MSNYSVSFKQTDGRMKGATIVCMWFYGFPHSFKEYENAHNWALLHFGKNYRAWQVRVIPIRKAKQICKNMVEVYSGRKSVSNGRFVIADESRPTYEQLLPTLERMKVNRPKRKKTDRTKKWGFGRSKRR